MAKKILIVEDEPFIADMYKLKFEGEGYDVAVACNGEEGLDMAMQNLPDLILLDIVMPKLDGYQVLQELKSHEVTKRIKVFILSNLGQNDEIEHGLAIGADGYFVKANLTPSQLTGNIEKIFAGDNSVGKRSYINTPKAIAKKTPVEKGDRDPIDRGSGIDRGNV